MKKKLRIFLVLVLFAFSSIFAYWRNIASPSAKEKNNTYQLGNWCFKPCRIYNPNDSYRVGEIIGYLDDEGNFQIIRATRNVSRGQHKDPKTVNKTGRNEGTRYRPDKAWFEDLTNEYIAFNHYYAGDFVYQDGKLYIYVGDYTRQRGGARCTKPREHDPTVSGCWGRPGQTTHLYGKVFWLEVANNLSTEHLENIWNKHQIYYRGDYAFFPKPTRRYKTLDYKGYIVNAKLKQDDLLRCTLISDDNRGIVGEQPLQSNKWVCN